MAKHHIAFTVNGDPVEVLCETQQTLLDVLRDELGLTGTKEGCGDGRLRRLQRRGRWPARMLVPDAWRRSQW